MVGENRRRSSTNRHVIMPRLRWSTTAAAIGAIIATGTGATMIAIGQTTGTKAIADTEIESQGVPPANGARMATGDHDRRIEQR